MRFKEEWDMMKDVQDKGSRMESRDLCEGYNKILDRECGLSVFGEKIKIAQELLELNLFDEEQVADVTGLSIQDVQRLKARL